MGVAIATLAQKESTVGLITIAQALTVFGIPSLAMVLIYLGFQAKFENHKIPDWMMLLAILGLIVACILAYLTAQKIYKNVFHEPAKSVANTRILDMQNQNSLPNQLDSSSLK